MSERLKKVFIKKNNTYILSAGIDPDFELSLLVMYFEECITYDLQKREDIQESIKEGSTGFNDLIGNLIDDKIQFYFATIDSFHEVRISQRNLLELIKTWFELLDAQAPQIVITFDKEKDYFYMNAE